jgi:hypothetical protein
MAKTGNTKQIKVQIFDAEANTAVSQYFSIDEYDSDEENAQAVDKLMLKLAGKNRLGES